MSFVHDNDQAGVSSDSNRLENCLQYDARVLTYDCRLFIRLAKPM